MKTEKKLKKNTKEKKSEAKGKEKKLSPLEKARIARKSGKAGKASAGKKKKKVLFKAPADFKPFFLEISARTEKDGLFGPAIKGVRYVGRYDPNAEDKKKFDISAYDMPTLLGVASRLSAATYKTNAEKRFPADIKERNSTEKVDGKVKLVHRTQKRLPPNTSFRIVMRVIKKKADDSLGVSIKSIEQGVENAKGRIKPVALDKKDPAYRAIRKAQNILASAFKGVLLPPKRGRVKKVKEEEDDE